MSEYNNNGEPETISGEVTLPEVVQTDVLATHREDVSKTIEAAFTSAIQKIVDRREYNTKVTCTNGPEPMSINVNISTNDPRVIAALASAGSKLQ